MILPILNIVEGSCMEKMKLLKGVCQMGKEGLRHKCRDWERKTVSKDDSKEK